MNFYLVLFQQQDGSAALRQAVGGRHAGQARADHHNVVPVFRAVHTIGRHDPRLGIREYVEVRHAYAAQHRPNNTEKSLIRPADKKVFNWC